MNRVPLLAFGSSFLLSELPVYEVIKRIPSWACDIKYDKKHKVDQREFSIWEHAVMNIEEGYRHSCYHRDDSNPDKQSDNKKYGAGKLAEYTEHQCHIASETEYARIGIRQFIKVHHLIQSMGKEEDTEEQSECKDQQRYNPVPAILGE